MALVHPILAAVTIPLLVLLYFRSRRLEPTGRWLLRAAFVCLWLTAGGLQLRCNRDLRIVVMTDVSPSTRGATFRDPQAVAKRLAPLLKGRPFETIHFADGVASGAGAVESARTRLPSSDADAILLLSDGRFDAPASLPPIYPVIDPALDAPADARVEEITFARKQARVTTLAPARTSLELNRTTREIPAGPFTSVTEASGQIVARVVAQDLWPENDQMSANAPTEPIGEPWIVSSASELPTDATRYLAPPAIAIGASVALDAERQLRLVQYARDLGGTLVLIGSPQAYPEQLRPIAPISASPPQPQSAWCVLLDASGSMSAPAAGAPRWQVAVSAAQGALQTLDERERVSVATFNRSLDVHLTGASPARALDRLAELSRSFNPTGPTGLRGALDQIAKGSTGQPTRLVIVTDADADLGAVAPLVDALRGAKVSVFLLATGDTAPAPVKQLVEQTGGQLLTQRDPSRWAAAMQSLLASARGDDVIDQRASLRGDGELSGLSIDLSRVFRGFARNEATTLAAHRETAVVASWRVGAGRVVSIAGDIEPGSLSAVLDRLKSPPADPRFVTEWDTRSGRVRVIANDEKGPINALSLSLARRDGTVERTDFEQIAPGAYEASLQRRSVATLATIDLNGQVVARASVPSRYAMEFDGVGNDRVALSDLATRTRGRVIEPGDNAPIHFAKAREFHDATPWLAGIGSALLGLSIVFIRAPYFTDVLRARFKRAGV